MLEMIASIVKGETTMANITRRRDDANYPSTYAPATEWDPFRVMDQLLRWDPFQGAVQQAPRQTTTFLPYFDVRETQDGYVFKADLPGVKENDLEISLTGNRLTITGHRETEERQANENYHLLERGYGAFSRSFTLPDTADMEQCKAELKEGVLTVVLPKRAEAQPRKINLNVQTGTGKA